MNRKQILQSILIILTFLFAFYGNQLLEHFIDIGLKAYLARVIYHFMWWLVAPPIVLGLMFGFKNIPKNLGLNSGFLTGLIFATITVAPMFISSAIIGSVEEQSSIGELLHKTAAAGFMEEYFFRGFLFGILFRKLNWGFIPAALLGAVIFGLGHLYQGSTLLETTGIFFITAMGAVWFAWLYIEWNNNLWVPIFLHTFMNLSWVLFSVSHTALGGITTNVFRVITIAATVLITIYYHKKRGLRIVRSNLIVNRKKD